MTTATIDGAIPTARTSHAAVVSSWPIALGIASATCIVAGIYWDISWHRTIGRDTFWTPAHLAIYLGGLLEGLGSGLQILRATFAPPTHADVRVLGFRGPLGAWVSAWGAIAMLTSAPLDDWWHNAYGLDVKILSPPHTVLALGMIALVIGARLRILAAQNRATGAELVALQRAHAYLAGVMMAMGGIVITERTVRVMLHRPDAYIAMAIVYPFFLITARASRLKYPLTAAAGVYMLLHSLQLWVLPLFPGEPRLGPVLMHVERFVPLDFPLLMVAPAFAMDLLLHRVRGDASLDDLPRSRWWLPLALGGVFLGVLVLVEWPFAEFLRTDASRNWFFNTENYGYYLGIESYMYRHEFIPSAGGVAFVRGFVIALVVACVSSAIALAWEQWMRRVRR